ncbi:MAG: SMP-30/gluconolactonase/LRE family protein [Prolixibacteraceae bacterium]|jgi:gluconolactonase|nr:SMP-30/gluconolactonase/LRE family protein [Prolixibacteraceae bacterium]
MGNQFILIVSMAILPFIAFAQPKVDELNWPVKTVYHGGFTEGVVVASDGLVYFSDMDSSSILQYKPATGKTTVWQQNSHASNGLFIHDNFLYACETTGRALTRYDLEKGSGSREILVNSFDGKKFGSPNDLTIINGCVFFSEFYMGSMLKPINAQREIYKNRVYRYSLSNKTTDTIKFNFEMPNGVAKSPDNSKFFIGDMQTNIIWCVKIRNSKIINIDKFADVSYLGESGPDGMAVAQNGNLFIALFREGKVLVLDKNGHPLGYLNTGPNTTNCFLTNNDRTLYVTADGKLKRVTITD